jgi:lipopolysaccharide/colanic/teichoic acid biosynthesis glycosyltransferase/glycosyltransferase involved in cell wall biosynthesis
VNPAPLHVLLVITKGEIGGAQTHVIELCRALRGRVRFSAVIGGEAGSFLQHALQALDVRALALPALRNSLNPLRVLASVRALRAQMRADPPDLIHAHSAVAGVVARLAGKLGDTPVVYTVHGFGFKPQAPALVRVNAWLAEAVLAAWTTRMVCVSDHEKSLAARLPMDPARASVIPNAIADVLWQSDQRTPEPALVMVARMAPPKRHDLLLQALALLATDGLRPATRLLGDGPQRTQHQHLANALDLPHAVFSGDVHNVPEQLAQHQIFVLLSDHEGLPISLIEAMRAGMAIVASRLPGVEELLVHGESALLVANDPFEIAQALRQLLEDAPLRQRLAAAARTRYEARHKPEAMGEQLLQVYEEAPLLPTATWPMTLPRRHRAALASEHARHQHSQLLWALLGTSALALAGLLGQWLRQQGWVTVDFSRTVLACLLPYGVAAHLLYRGAHLPAAERGVLLLVTTAVPFVLTPLGFALTQTPYSRSALLLSYLLTTAWFWLGYRWLIAPRALKLLYWDTAQPARLQVLLARLGPQAEAAARGRLQLLRWPAHWRHQPERCPGVLSVQGALADAPEAGAPAEPQRRAILTTLKLHHVRLYGALAVAEALSGRVPDEVLASELWQPDGNPAYDLLKRVLDLTAVLLTAPLWLPLAALVALAVRLDSPGPAVFSQWRTGLHGQPFRIHKFRSMRHTTQDKPQFAGEFDPRITRLGAFLRKTRLDEIPQLWNVLRGDMSLIGPRPEQTAFVQQFAQDIPSYPWRHLVRPGLTGWAQVQQGYAASAQETAVKLSYDLYYVTHYSLAMDLLILAKTLRTVLTGHGAR